jgi:hypothetical protein
MNIGLTDTPPEVQRIQYEMLREMPAWKLMALTSEMIRTSRGLMLVNLRSRYPSATDEEIRRRFISRLLSRDEVIRVYGFEPILD